MEDFSLIILCRGKRHLLPLTLDTLKKQTGSFEVLLLDGEGSGRLLELAHRYPSLQIRVQDTSGHSLPTMMNEGVRQAKGRYVQFLEPGDRYLSPHGLSFLSELIAERPSLITAREVVQESQSHWILREKILELGGFDEQLHFRPFLDFLFRFENQGGKPLICRRALVDSLDGNGKSLFETCKILYRHFGIWHVMKWLFHGDHSALFRRTVTFFKQAFWKSNT